MMEFLQRVLFPLIFILGSFMAPIESFEPNETLMVLRLQLRIMENSVILRVFVGLRMTMAHLDIEYLFQRRYLASKWIYRGVGGLGFFIVCDQDGSEELLWVFGHVLHVQNTRAVSTHKGLRDKIEAPSRMENVLPDRLSLAHFIQETVEAVPGHGIHCFEPSIHDSK